MDNSSLEISLKNATSNDYDYSNHSDYSNYFDYGNYFDFSSYFDYGNHSDYGIYFDFSSYFDFSNHSDYGIYFDFSSYFDFSNHSDYGNDLQHISFFGRISSGGFAWAQFVESCLLISLGLPLTLGAIYGLYSQVRNGEVAPIYVINLLISDLVQFCCMIVEVAQLQDWSLRYEYWEIFNIFKSIYVSSLMVSVGFMVCIALERYLVVVHPLWYRCRRTIKSSVLVCVLVWILPVVYTLIERFSVDYRVTLVIFSIFFLLPLPLLIFFLVATIRALSASISVPTEEKRRIAGMLILVLLIYLLLFLPAIIMYVYNQTSYYISHLEHISDLAAVFLKLSPLADLVLYILLRKGTIRQLWAGVCRCRKESNETSAVAVIDVNMSAVRDGEREGQRAEEG